MSLSKLPLTHPLRIDMITAHRKMRAEAAKTAPSLEEKLASVSISSSDFELNGISYETRLSQAALVGGGHVQVIESMSGFQLIINDPRKNSLENKMFVLTVIDEPYVENELCFGDFLPFHNILVETVGKEVCNLVVNGLPNNEATLEMFSVGTKIHLFNPTLQWGRGPSGEMVCVRFVMDAREKRNIFPVGKVTGMCRFCGKENVHKSCAVCKVPYCSKMCQETDWKLNKHKLVCKKAEAKEETLESREDEANAASKSNEPELLTSGLMNPERISRILYFRRKYNSLLIRSRESRTLLSFQPSVVNVPDLPLPASPKLVFLKDMKCENIYENHVIELTVIDEALLGFPYVHFLVEDKNKDVTYLAVKGLRKPGDHVSVMQFLIGATFLVHHPFYKYGVADGLPMIRVEHLETIKHLKKKISLCRYCGEENAKRKCAGCFRTYCGKECESKDWEVLNHDLLCKTGPFSMIEAMSSRLPSPFKATAHSALR